MANSGDPEQRPRLLRLVCTNSGSLQLCQNVYLAFKCHLHVFIMWVTYRKMSQINSLKARWSWSQKRITLKLKYNGSFLKKKKKKKFENLLYQNILVTIQKATCTCLLCQYHTCKVLDWFLENYRRIWLRNLYNLKCDGQTDGHSHADRRTEKQTWKPPRQSSKCVLYIQCNIILQGLDTPSGVVTVSLL